MKILKRLFALIWIVSKVPQLSYLINYKCPLGKARVSCSFWFRYRHFHTCSCTTEARTKLWLQLRRSASSALCVADTRPSRFKAAVLLYGEPTSTLRQPAEPPPLHPWLTLFHCYSIWHTARCRSVRMKSYSGARLHLHGTDRSGFITDHLAAGLQIVQIKQSLEMWNPQRVCAFQLKRRFQGNSATKTEHSFIPKHSALRLFPPAPSWPSEGVFDCFLLNV